MTGTECQIQNVRNKKAQLIELRFSGDIHLKTDTRPRRDSALGIDDRDDVVFQVLLAHRYLGDGKA